ncbi:MAG: exonuclease SbcCD subunit D [Deltaproteobacteria bacterium]|nr:exonuclease SbcCD subunit D [Deltaproteobacteria bacterium]
MPQFTFIHAADLHLGAPFKGLDEAATGALAPSRGRGNLLAEAGFAALNRLETACLEANAAFLILAGDIYDDKDGVLRARFALRDMFLRLRDAGVRVFIAHGNHDPLRSGPLPVAWPENVTVFGRDVSCECVRRGGVPLALVRGISHASTRETDNLALRFAPGLPEGSDAPSLFAGPPDDLPPDIFQVAVLHCAVGGAGEGHAPYAPCSLSDLTGAGFDYWALGHVHQGGTLCEAPFVVYPGSAQGLHINETGPHGCCVVRVDGKACAVERLPLAPVVWEKLPFAVTESVATIDGLEEALCAALEGRADALNDAQALFCRVILEGATDLDAELRRPGSLQTLLDRLRKGLSAGGGPVRVWIKDIRLATSPVRDFAALADRDDLVGEVVRLAASMAENPEKAATVVDRALAPLYGNAKVKKALAGSEDGPVPPLLAEEAKALLCSLLEGGE